MPAPQPRALPYAPALLAAAAALAQAIQVASGALSPSAIAWLALACAAGLFALTAPHRLVRHASSRWLTVLVGAVAVAAQLAQLLTTAPGMYLQLRGPEAVAPYFTGIALGSFFIGAGLARDPWLGRLQLSASSLPRITSPRVAPPVWPAEQPCASAISSWRGAARIERRQGHAGMRTVLEDEPVPPPPLRTPGDCQVPRHFAARARSTSTLRFTWPG